MSSPGQKKENGIHAERLLLRYVSTMQTHLRGYIFDDLSL